MQSVSPDQFRDWSFRLCASDRVAYAELFQATYEPLFRYAWRFTRDEEAAYDVLQETFMKVWVIRETIDPDRSLKALLYHMTRNFALNHKRYAQRHRTEPLEPGVLEPSIDPQPAAALDTRALREQLRGWIDALPPRRREAFMLSRYEGLSHDEIAQVMGLTPKTVNNHIVLALQQLRDLLQSRTSDPLTS